MPNKVIIPKSMASLELNNTGEPLIMRTMVTEQNTKKDTKLLERDTKLVTQTLKCPLITTEQN